MSFLKIIRPYNLFLIALLFAVIRYGIFDPFEIDTILSNLGVGLLALATMLIAAGGYVINDIMDQDADAINKPHKKIVGVSMTEKTAYNFYFALTVIGVLLGFYLSNSIGYPAMSGIFIFTALLLYLYATSVKSMLLVGNILTSLLVGFTVLLPAFFDLFPVTTTDNQEIQQFMFGILLDFAIFAFFINLLREFVKDIQDIDGDHADDRNSLPIAFGRKRAQTITAVVAALFVGFVIFYTVSYLYGNQIATGYFLIFIIAPLMYISYATYVAETKKDFARISMVLKLIMLFGVLSLFIFSFNIN